MGRTVMLTTNDNPYDPISQYEDWLKFDEQSGYYTNEYLARIARTSHDLSETDELMAIEEAIDEIVALNVIGSYKKLVYED